MGRVVARARQFSMFVLMLGKLAAGDEFQPSHAILVQNKDEILIPLKTNTIASAQQFREAINSMSPEQQRFASAFRSMQLEGSMFALVVVDVKPQLERLLQLPAGALTREIKLTQELCELFVKYQIPADLLSYDGSPNRKVEKK